MSIQQSIPCLKTQPSLSTAPSASAAQGFVPGRPIFEPRPVPVPHSKPTDVYISLDSEDEYVDSTSEDDYSDMDEVEDERKSTFFPNAVMYSFQVGAGEFHLYQSRYYTFDEAKEVFYALRERRNAE